MGRAVPRMATRRAAGLHDLPGSRAVNPRNGPRLRTDDPNTFSRLGESLGTWGLSYEDHWLGCNRILRT
jgi:hypothetical protein